MSEAFKAGRVRGEKRARLKMSECHPSPWQPAKFGKDWSAAAKGQIVCKYTVKRLFGESTALRVKAINKNIITLLHIPVRQNVRRREEMKGFLLISCHQRVHLQ